MAYPPKLYPRRVNSEASDQLIGSIDELQRLYELAKDDITSPAWQEMQRRLADVQEQVERLKPPHQVRGASH
jgi:hypothetical protein